MVDDLFIAEDLVTAVRHHFADRTGQVQVLFPHDLFDPVIQSPLSQRIPLHLQHILCQIVVSVPCVPLQEVNKLMAERHTDIMLFPGLRFPCFLIGREVPPFNIDPDPVPAFCAVQHPCVALESRIAVQHPCAVRERQPDAGSFGHRAPGIHPLFCSVVQSFRRLAPSLAVKLYAVVFSCPLSRFQRCPLAGILCPLRNIFRPRKVVQPLCRILPDLRFRHVKVLKRGVSDQVRVPHEQGRILHVPQFHFLQQPVRIVRAVEVRIILLFCDYPRRSQVCGKDLVRIRQHFLSVHFHPVLQHLLLVAVLVCFGHCHQVAQLAVQVPVVRLQDNSPASFHLFTLRALHVLHCGHVPGLPGHLHGLPRPYQRFGRASQAAFFLRRFGHFAQGFRLRFPVETVVQVCFMQRRNRPEQFPFLLRQSVDAILVFQRTGDQFGHFLLILPVQVFIFQLFRDMVHQRAAPTLVDLFARFAHQIAGQLARRIIADLLTFLQVHLHPAGQLIAFGIRPHLRTGFHQPLRRCLRTVDVPVLDRVAQHIVVVVDPRAAHADARSHADQRFLRCHPDLMIPFPHGQPGCRIHVAHFHLCSVRVCICTVRQDILRPFFPFVLVAQHFFDIRFNNRADHFLTRFADRDFAHIGHDVRRIRQPVFHGPYFRRRFNRCVNP